MIKRFKKRFVLMAMTALLVVLVLIIGGINIYNFHEVTEDADALLQIISENHGSFPDSEAFNYIEPEMIRDFDFHKGKHGGEPGYYSPETPYETRYFYVGIDKSTGEADIIGTSKIVAVDDADAEQLARKALDKDKVHGYLGFYRFYVAQGRQHTFVVFVDCGRMLESSIRFFVSSVAISAVGYILVYVIVAFLSRYAIRPVMAGYEKQRQFVSNAGHEIKTPLTIIRADVDILEMDLGENKWIKDIRRQVQRLSDLTEELSKLCRMDEPEQPIYMTDLVLSDLVMEQAAAFERVAVTKGLKLTSQVEPGHSFHGNGKALRQLCSNLLDNAIKYSSEAAEIRLSFQKKGKYLCLMVENPSKHPLPVHDLEQIFERFYRTDTSRNSEDGGFGIGLAVARGVAISHGGKISAHCSDGTNLTIKVLLPCT